ncbi:MAG: hypothetical protein Q4D57_02865 [Clostridia bacterium]|nr:hypothetical protein [Clostridia bacterium]
MIKQRHAFIVSNGRADRLARQGIIDLAHFVYKHSYVVPVLEDSARQFQIGDFTLTLSMRKALKYMTGTTKITRSQLDRFEQTFKTTYEDPIGTLVDPGGCDERFPYHDELEGLLYVRFTAIDLILIAKNNLTL